MVTTTQPTLKARLHEVLDNPPSKEHRNEVMNEMEPSTLIDNSNFQDLVLDAMKDAVSNPHPAHLLACLSAICMTGILIGYEVKTREVEGGES